MNKYLLPAIGLTLFLLLVGLWYFFVKVPAENVKDISTFEECVAVYPIITLQYPAKCTTSDGRTFIDTVTPTPTPTQTVIGMANPASVYCEKQGGVLEIVDQTGGQIGMCTLDSGKVCEEWAYYRGECK